MGRPPRSAARSRHCGVGGARVARGSWKTPYVAEWVGDRPFVWVDDGVGEEDVAYFPADHQIVWPVDPRTGLTAADFAAIGKAFADNEKWPHP